MNAPIKKTNSPSPLYAGQYSREQVDLLKTTICKGASDDQMTVFLHICKHTGLDPFAKQIYLVPRWDNKEKKEIWTPQTSIDGQRLVAERTGRYCPGKESTFTYDKNGQLLSATAYVKKQTVDGTWHEVSATAYWSEYVQKTKDGQPTSMWRDKPHIMLSKCAESLCLRKCFPNELSGVYTSEEMGGDAHGAASESAPSAFNGNGKFDAGQTMRITTLLEGADDYREKLLAFYGVNSIDELPSIDYAKILRSAQKYIESTAVIVEAQSEES